MGPHSQEAICSSIYLFMVSNSVFPVCVDTSATISYPEEKTVSSYRNQVPYMMLEIDENQSLLEKKYSTNNHHPTYQVCYIAIPLEFMTGIATQFIPC